MNARGSRWTWPECPRCGSTMGWENCNQVGCDDGETDLYDIDPLWYGPNDVEVCDWCEVKGGYWVCFEKHEDEPCRRGNR